MQTQLLKAEVIHQTDTDVIREGVPDTDPDLATDALEVAAVDPIRDRLIEIGELRDEEVPPPTVQMSLLKSMKSSTAFTVNFLRIQSQIVSITFFRSIRTCCSDARLVINILHSYLTD
jgi:hypothetical protein